MISDTMIIDPNTGEVLAEPGQRLDSEQLYRLELSSVTKYQATSHEPALTCPYCGGDLLSDNHWFDGDAFHCEVV